MNFFKKEIDKNYYYIGLLILLLFMIGANLAWTNFQPQVAKTNPKIPIMWQYDCDSSVDFLSGAFFPEYFKYNGQRINRPTFPFFAKLFGETIGLLVLPFYKMSVLLKTMLGYITLKLLFYYIGAVFLYKIIKDWLGQQIAFLSVIAVFFHPHSVQWIATFATAPAQFITPIIIIFLFNDLLKKYSTKKNIFYSIIAGVLLLIKENYAVYLAILFFALFKKRFKAAGTSIAGFLVPQAGWLLLLALYKIPYHNEQISGNNQVTWIFNDFLYRHPINMIQTFIFSIKDWLVMYAEFYHVFFVLALLAFVYKPIRNKFNNSVILFLVLFLFFSWFQVFAVNLYDRAFRVADLAFIIFPLGVFVLCRIIYRYFNKKQAKRILATSIFLYILLSVISFVRLPWVHPYNQINVLEKKAEKINTYDRGVIYQSQSTMKKNTKK